MKWYWWWCSFFALIHFVSTSNHRYNETLKRQKRYLIFEKGSALTCQVNIAKSVLMGAPRGLNEITEFTVSYDVPTDFHQLYFKRQPRPLTTTTTSTTTDHPHFVLHSPFYYDQKPFILPSKEYLHPKQQKLHRKYWRPKFCDRIHFKDMYGNPKKICLHRSKRNVDNENPTMSERIFYDLIEKWSQIQGYHPRYCFMRTLCEARHLLMPRGLSLLHDVIRILLRFSIPWALRHDTFGRSLHEGNSLADCIALYGPHCRISWLDHVTNVVHGFNFIDEE